MDGSLKLNRKRKIVRRNSIAKLEVGIEIEKPLSYYGLCLGASGRAVGTATDRSMKCYGKDYWKREARESE